MRSPGEADISFVVADKADGTQPVASMVGLASFACLQVSSRIELPTDRTRPAVSRLITYTVRVMGRLVTCR